MKFINGLIIGLIIGIAGFWYFASRSGGHGVVAENLHETYAAAQAETTNAASHFSDALRARLDALDLRADEVRNELAKTGKIVRRKATDFGQAVADQARDARDTASIKAKFATDPDLSVWQISVSCTDGHVTLSGSVDKPEDVAKAVAYALDVDGVTDVTSTIIVKNPSAA